jgi:ATP-binding cassette subfamily C exporter for protease/lipase/ATP-binding cassette subfamily C protein EexD
MREVLRRFRRFFAYAALFSFVVNVLLLAPVLYMLQVFDRVIASRSVETLVLLSVAVAIALAIMMALEFARAQLLAAAGVAIDRMLGPAVLEGLLRGAARLGGADYLHGMRDVASLRAFLSGPGIFAIFDAPWLPLFLILIYLFHPVLGVTAMLGALVLVSLALTNERLTRKPIEALQTDSRRVGRYIDSAVHNAEVISALGMGRSIASRWDKLNLEVLRGQRETSRTAGMMGGATRFARQVLQTAMLGVGAYLVIEQRVTPGVMIAATIILGRALAPVEMMIAGWKQLVEARAAYRRLDELLGREPAPQSGIELPPPQGAVAVERVVFTAPGLERPIIKGVSFQLRPGEALAILGPSAAGKSTLARLLVGVWRPTAGVVRLDGADVSQWPHEQLGPHIGYLPQDVELFAGTVAENIARLGEVASDAVIDAAVRANVHETILRLPQGYDTPIGEGGSALSAGQRQRIALARALYGAPRLVVLDEPNANLDGEGELALVRAMQGLREAGATQVIITHRPSLLTAVDTVLVLQDGAVQQFGPRDEVLLRLRRAMGTGPLRAVDAGPAAGAVKGVS